MSVYHGPRLRIIRRLGTIFAFTRKISIRYTDQQGQHRKKSTPFAERLIEKQKIRFFYGITEKQLLRCISIAKKQQAQTGKVLVQRLDIRLDNIVYRIGWARTVPSARQMVRHGHVLVDQTRITIPSFTCTPGQCIKLGYNKAIRETAENNLRERIERIPSHLKLKHENFTLTVTQHSDCRETPLRLNELLVVEYYSNRI